MASRSLLAYTFIAVGLGQACGGSAEREAAPSSLGGGRNVGGSTAALGGSTAALGGSTAALGGATTTSGEELPEACQLPFVDGACDALLPVYWHDPKIGLCVPAIYGGCGGNANRFGSLAECQAACRGVLPGGTELDRCNTNSDCQLDSAGCCGACGSETERDFLAIRSDMLAAARSYRGCSSIACGACLEPPANERNGRYFYAACVDNQCVVRDLRKTALTGCNAAADCQLRCGTGCCNGCDGASVVALRKDAFVAEEFCGGASTPCPACVCPLDSPWIAANCVAGRCVVEGEFGCTFGMDQTCNEDSLQSSLSGTCGTNGTCTCNPGRTLVARTGRCR